MSNPSQQDKLPTEYRSPEEVREWLNSFHLEFEPHQVLLEIEKALSEQRKGPMDVQKVWPKVTEAMMMTGYERHYLVAESVADKRWRPMVTDLAQSIQKEYQCVKTSEIALAGLAASAYYRSLHAARKLNGLLDMNTMGDVVLGLIGHVSKEIERADRQYLAAIETLRSRRQPQVDVKIQAKTAFFGQNQTINAHPQKPYENNDPH